MAESSSDDLVARVLSGDQPQLERLAAEGVLPLAQEDLVRLQIHLLKSDDEEIAQKAQSSLEGLNLSVLLDYVRHEAGPEELGWFLRKGSASALVEAAIQRPGITSEMLEEVAPRLGERAQEVLLLRQDLITEHPEILEALDRNPELTPYSQRLIGEYRRHLLAPAEEPEEAPEADDEELSEEEQAEIDAAIADARENVEAEGDFDEVTGLTEGQVRMLPLPVRVKLARGAGRTLRGILVKDNNHQVALTVLKASAFSEAEAEMVSNNRFIAAEVLQEIAQRRDWIGKYQILHNVVRNPRTPVAIAVRLVPRLSIRELALLGKDRNVADAVRQMAVRLHSARTR